MNGSSLRRSRGQELLEFAITLPILLVLVFGILDLGRAVYYYSAVQNAAREGARYGIVHPGDSVGVIAAAEQKAVAVNPLVVSIPLWDDEVIRVRAAYQFTPVTPFIGALLPELWIVGSSTMYVEY